MATVTGSNTASAASVTINRRKNPDKTAPLAARRPLDIRCNSEGEIPLALPQPEVKPRFPQPLKLMHFHSGPLMYFCSGVDTDLIVTVNLKDFPTAALSSQGIVAAHPDPFVDYLFDLDEPEAVDAVARMRSRLRAPSLSPDDFIDSIAQVGMPLTASRLRNLSNRI